MLLNKGLGEGDQVSLRKNDLVILDFFPAGTTDSEVIKTLSSRGVTVSFDSVSDGSAMPDLALTRAVKTALSQGPGELTSAKELAGITELRVRETVRNLTGLELLVSLKQLTLLSVDSLHDLAPLAGFTQLTSLRLERNAFTATTPLDLSALANLTNLTEVNLRWNMVEDISPLANLTKLTSLKLPRNKLEDISPLANLTNLAELDLRDNRITDISPLLANSGIGAGDTVSLENNNLDLSEGSVDLQVIRQLETRGAFIGPFVILWNAVGQKISHGSSNHTCLTPRPRGTSAPRKPVTIISPRYLTLCLVASTAAPLCATWLRICPSLSSSATP